MKKISITVNVLFLGIILFMSCNKTNINPSDKAEAVSSGKNTSAHGTNNHASKADCPTCYDYSQTYLEGINTSTAITMSYNYKTIDQQLLNTTLPGDDANSVWFSLESLKNFVWKIEKAVCEQNCPDALKLGIRIYYGRYPQTMTGEFAALDPLFAEHHTVFMVPTFQDAGNSTIHWDFDPWHWGKNCKPTSMVEWFAGSPRPFDDDAALIFSIGGNQYFMNTGSGVLSSAFNHGDLIPPYPMTGAAY